MMLHYQDSNSYVCINFAKKFIAYKFLHIQYHNAKETRKNTSSHHFQKNCVAVCF